jgi:hypothetical protein
VRRLLCPHMFCDLARICALNTDPPPAPLVCAQPGLTCALAPPFKFLGWQVLELFALALLQPICDSICCSRQRMSRSACWRRSAPERSARSRLCFACLLFFLSHRSGFGKLKIIAHPFRMVRCAQSSMLLLLRLALPLQPGVSPSLARAAPFHPSIETSLEFSCRISEHRLCCHLGNTRVTLPANFSLRAGPAAESVR